MEPNRASITALVTAHFRAYHATHDFPKIFDDFLADQMYTQDEHISYDQNLAGLLKIINPERAVSNPDQVSALACVMQTYSGPITLSRSRYTEDSLEQAVEQGVVQYVLLGAGLDTFAFRRPDLVERIQVFEVDHPATQAMKHERLAMLGREYPPQLHFIPVDFDRESLADALLRSSYDPQKLSFFSWLGVTYYLSREAVFATLEAIAKIAPKGSALVFDYMEADAFIPEKAAKRIRLMQTIAAQVGEPMQAGFDPLALAGELKALGFTLEENLSPAEIEGRYFKGRQDEYHAFEQVHFAWAVVV
jgi:methyltransferase (TIGR00027 family)